MANLENRVLRLEEQMAREVTPDSEIEFSPLMFKELLDRTLARVKEEAATRPPKTLEQIQEDAKALAARWREKIKR